MQAISPGIRHLSIARSLYSETGCTGRMTTDVHIASLAIERNGTVYSNDRDFARFEGLSVINPLL